MTLAPRPFSIFCAIINSTLHPIFKFPNTVLTTAMNRFYDDVKILWQQVITVCYSSSRHIIIQFVLHHLPSSHCLLNFQSLTISCTPSLIWPTLVTKELCFFHNFRDLLLGASIRRCITLTSFSSFRTHPKSDQSLPTQLAGPGWSPLCQTQVIP